MTRALNYALTERGAVHATCLAAHWSVGGPAVCDLCKPKLLPDVSPDGAARALAAEVTAMTKDHDTLGAELRATNAANRELRRRVHDVGNEAFAFRAGLQRLASPTRLFGGEVWTWAEEHRTRIDYAVSVLNSQPNDEGKGNG